MSGNRVSVVLELQEVSLNFKSSKSTFDHGIHHILEKVSFKLHQGETLGIVGRNGVGKTTILRVMAGILPPTSGKVITQAGQIASLLSIGVGFQPELSGRDNALLSAMLQGATKSHARSCLEEIKEFSELGDSFEEPVKTYSSGMNARLGFTTALITHVDILLVDEVLSVGDAQFRAKAETAMRDRIGSDQTVVLVSHNNSQIQSLCDRAIWIEGGRIASEGATKQVLQDYQSHIKNMSREKSPTPALRA